MAEFGYFWLHITETFPGGSAVKNPPASAASAEEVSLTPWRRKWQPTPVFLLGQSHGQRSLAGYSPWGLKELEMTERLHSTTEKF